MAAQCYDCVTRRGEATRTSKACPDNARMQTRVTSGACRVTGPRLASPEDPGLEAGQSMDHFRSMKRFSLIARFLSFRNELATLWRAFLAPETPIHLRALMLLVPAYLLSPIDLIPDLIPLLGWADDFVVIPLLVGWIVRMLPQKAPVYQRSADGAKVIDGTYRRH